MGPFGFLATIAAWLATAIPLFAAQPGSGGWLLGGTVFGILTALIWGALVPLGALGANTTMVALGIIALVGGGGFAVYCSVVLVFRGAGVHLEITQQ